MWSPNLTGYNRQISLQLTALVVLIPTKQTTTDVANTAVNLGVRLAFQAIENT